MKRIILILATAAGCIAAALAAPASNGATVLLVSSAATLESASGKVAAQKGAVVPAGTTIETQKENTAKVGLPDGSVVEIEQQTRVTFDRVQAAPLQVDLHLTAGTLRLNSAASNAPRLVTVHTAQAQVAFHEQSGYITSKPDQDVVTCLHCKRLDARICDRNDFFVKDLTSCLSLSDAMVVFVTREHGIQASPYSEEGFVRTVLGQLGANPPEGSTDKPWWSANPNALKVSQNALAMAKSGQQADLQVTGFPDSGSIWPLSIDTRVARVVGADWHGTCTLQATGQGRGAVIIYDQQGRYTVVPIEVGANAAR